MAYAWRTGEGFESGRGASSIPTGGLRFSGDMGGGLAFLRTVEREDERFPYRYRVA